MAFTNAARNLAHRWNLDIPTFLFYERLLLHGLRCDAGIPIKLKIHRKFKLWLFCGFFYNSILLKFHSQLKFTLPKLKVKYIRSTSSEKLKMQKFSRACAKNLNSKSTLFRSEMTIITSFIKYCWLKNRVGENLGFWNQYKERIPTKKSLLLSL